MPHTNNPNRKKWPKKSGKKKKTLPAQGDEGKDGGKELTAAQKKRSLKNTIRGVERLLKKDTLPENVRKEKEEQLKSLREQLEGKAEKEREKKFAVKYRKVRFFERRKIMRKIKKAEKALAAAENEGGDTVAAEKVLAELRVDLDYVVHFPKNTKYMSLFPNKDSVDSEEVNKKRAEVREEIRERMARRREAADHNSEASDSEEDLLGNSEDEAPEEEEEEDDFFLAADATEEATPKRKGSDGSGNGRAKKRKN